MNIVQFGPSSPIAQPTPRRQSAIPHPRRHALRSSLAVLVIAVVVAILVAEFSGYSIHPTSKVPSSGGPAVALGEVGFVVGNATVDVRSVSPMTPINRFKVNLRVGSVLGVAEPVEPDPGYALVRVSDKRYQVYIVDLGNYSALNAGDRFIVAGDGAPLPQATPFTFYLLWLIDGTIVASSNWTTPTLTKPLVTFFHVDLATSPGNASIPIESVSQLVGPTNFEVNLQVGVNTGTAVPMPTTGNTYVTVVVGAMRYRLYWTSRDQYVGAGDGFLVAGNNSALPSETSFTFYFLWSDASLIQSAAWTTP